MIIGTIREENQSISLWRAFHEFSGYDCSSCQLKCCYGPYNLPLVDNSRIIELKAKFPLFSLSCLNDADFPSKHVKTRYHRETGCYFLGKDGKCAIHDENISSIPEKPLRPLVCQLFPLILRKTTVNGSQPLRFVYVHPCGSGTGFQWISKKPITNASIIDLARQAEPFYDQCFCDQVDSQDSHQDVDFAVLDQYEWMNQYMSTIDKPMLDELHSLASLSTKELNSLAVEIRDFLGRWNNYLASSSSSSPNDLTIDVLTKRELGAFNPFIIWVAYNARLMEITEPTTRWRVGLAATLFPIFHALLSTESPDNDNASNWIQLVNESCWEMVHLVVTTLPTLAEQRKLSHWEQLERLFSLLNP